MKNQINIFSVGWRRTKHEVHHPLYELLHFLANRLLFQKLDYIEDSNFHLKLELQPVRHYPGLGRVRVNKNLVQCWWTFLKVKWLKMKLPGTLTETYTYLLGLSLRIEVLIILVLGSVWTLTVLVEEFKILISTFSHVSVVDDPLKESPELFIVQYDFGFIGFISDCIPIEVSVGPSQWVSSYFSTLLSR